MKLQINKTSKDIHYYLAETIRIGNKTKTINIKKFGVHSELLKIHEDPEAHLREIVKNINNSLDSNDFRASVDVNLNKILTPDEKVGSSDLLNVGHFFINQIYKKLELPKFFKNIDNNNKHTFNIND